MNDLPNDKITIHVSIQIFSYIMLKWITKLRIDTSDVVDSKLPIIRFARTGAVFGAIAIPHFLRY